MNVFPPYGPDGRPAYWKDEGTGRLRLAVQAFFADPPIATPESLRLLQDYVLYWMGSPGFHKGDHEQWTELTELVDRASTVEELQAALYRLQEDYCIDPF